MRLIACRALRLISANSAFARPERDRAWNALIAEAQEQGGRETRDNDLASYMFQRPDGSALTLTRTLNNSLRAVCLISKERDLVVCRDWDTAQIHYSWRADAPSSWTHSDSPPPADGVAQRTPVDLMLNFLGQVLATGSQSSGSYWRARAGGYWRNSATGPHWVTRR